MISSSFYPPYTLCAFNEKNILEKIRNKMTLIPHHLGLIVVWHCTTSTVIVAWSVTFFFFLFAHIHYVRLIEKIISVYTSLCLAFCCCCSSYFNIVIKIDFITLIWIPIFLWHLFFCSFFSFKKHLHRHHLHCKQSFYKLTFYSFTLSSYLQRRHTDEEIYLFWCDINLLVKHTSWKYTNIDTKWARVKIWEHRIMIWTEKQLKEKALFLYHKSLYIIPTNCGKHDVLFSLFFPLKSSTM